MPTKRCYYEVLGITRTSDDGSVKAAYRKLVLQYHPDRNAHDPETEVKFKEVQEAYEVLREPGKRQRYDRYGHAGMSDGAMGPGDGGDAMSDMVSDFFGGIFGGGGGNLERHAGCLRQASGGVFEVDLRRRQDSLFW